jgi:hypothetical protein
MRYARRGSLPGLTIVALFTMVQPVSSHVKLAGGVEAPSHANPAGGAEASSPVRAKRQVACRPRRRR